MTPELRNWKPVFLAALAECPNVTGAARAAGIERQTAYLARQTDQEFAKAWQDALEASTDDLIGEIHRRAVKGVTKPVYQGGVKVGDVQEYSDTLAIFLAKAHRPAIYRETVNQNLSGGATIRVVYDEPDFDPETSSSAPGPAGDPQGNEAV